MPRERLTGRRRGTGQRGPGAPKGNLNALKHGRRSKQFQAFSARVFDDPRVFRIVLRILRANAELQDELRRRDISRQPYFPRRRIQ